MLTYTLFSMYDLHVLLQFHLLMYVYVMITCDRHMIICVKSCDYSHMKSHMISIYDLHVLQFQFHLLMFAHMMITYDLTYDHMCETI